MLLKFLKQFPLNNVGRAEKLNCLEKWLFLILKISLELFQVHHREKYNFSFCCHFLRLLHQVQLLQFHFASCGVSNRYIDFFVATSYSGNNQTIHGSTYMA